MKELEKEFTGKGEMSGIKFKQLKGSDKAFLYQLNQEEAIWYEVFENKIQKETDVSFGGVSVHYEEKVLYPKSNDFGNWAWCVNKYETALNKFEEINNRVVVEIDN